MRSASAAALVLFVAAIGTCSQLDEQSGKAQAAAPASLNHGRFEFSADVVPEPLLRDQLSTLVTKLVIKGGSLDDTDRRLLSTGSDAVASVIRAVWPSLSGLHLLDSDGALQYEKYNLLDALPDSPIYVQLLRDVLRAEHISSSMTYVLLRKPSQQELASELLRQIDWSKAHDDVDGQIYCVAVLIAWHEKTAGVALDGLSKLPKLSPAQHKTIQVLQQRAVIGGRVLFRDLEELEFPSNFKR